MSCPVFVTPVSWFSINSHFLRDKVKGKLLVYRTIYFFVVFCFVSVCLLLSVCLFLFCSPFNRSEGVKHCKDILIFLWGLVKSRIAMIFLFHFQILITLNPHNVNKTPDNKFKHLHLIKKNKKHLT